MSEDFVRPGAVRTKTPEQRDQERAARLATYKANTFARQSVLELEDESTRQDRLERIAGLPIERKPSIVAAFASTPGYSDLSDEVRAQVTEALKP